nr:hypothetical protein [Candidatus Sigynarchaeota archaeon]
MRKAKLLALVSGLLFIAVFINDPMSPGSDLAGTDGDDDDRAFPEFDDLETVTPSSLSVDPNAYVELVDEILYNEKYLLSNRYLRDEEIRTIITFENVDQKEGISALISRMGGRNIVSYKYLPFIGATFE